MTRRSTTTLPETMRVVELLESGATSLRTRPMPTPSRGEMVLAMRVSGLCGTDLFKLEHRSEPAGSVLGHEIVGEVCALGEGVAGFSIGDRVVVPHHVACGRCELCERGSETKCEVFRENLLEPGGFAEAILVRPRAVELAARRIPDSVGDSAASFLEPAACVLRGIERAGLAGTGAAVVLGAGGMGLLHLLVLRALDASRPVVVVDPLAPRRSLAEKLGATATSTPGDNTARRVQELTDGLGADAVFDTVGGAATLRDGLEMTRPGGTVVLFAHARQGERADFDLNDLFKHERRVIGTYSGSLREQESVFELLGSGRLDPSQLVTHRLPLELFAEGVKSARSLQAIKVLFTGELAGGAT